MIRFNDGPHLRDGLGKPLREYPQQCLRKRGHDKGIPQCSRIDQNSSERRIGLFHESRDCNHRGAVHGIGDDIAKVWIGFVRRYSVREKTAPFVAATNLLNAIRGTRARAYRWGR